MKKKITKRNLIALLMKTSVSLMLIVLVAGMTYGRDGLAQDLLKRSVTIEAEQRDLKTVLNQLEKTARVRFSYTPSLIRDRKVSLMMQNQPLEEVLIKLLRPLRIQYTVSGGYIILNRDPGSTGVNQAPATSASTDMASVEAAKPEDKAISGNVTDEKRQGLPGVNVVIKGTTRGTTTNADGSYRLTVPEGPASTLVFSLVGYTSQEIVIGTRSTLDIQLLPDNKTLSEVVVVGYGTQKKSDLTGAIASVSPATITRAATSDATGAMQGNLPGVVVVKNVGKPGSGYSINVRGTNSFGGSNSPLFVIDGIPTTSGLNDLNPADIDKIDVLKDASATAIYGSRGAKGVVIVTTKRGKSGKTTISYDGYLGVKAPIHLPDMMDGPEYVAFRTQLFQAQGRDISRTNTAFFTPEQWANIDAGKFTDWPSMFLKNSLQTNHNISASGGDDKTRFSLGAGFMQEDGNVSPESFKRYSFRGNVDRQISEKWKAGINFYISQDLQNQGSYEALRSAYRLPPTVSPYDSNGDRVFRVLGGDGVINPLYDQDNDIRMNRYFRAFGNIYVQLQPIQGLTLKSTFSPNYYTTRTAWFIGGLSKEGAGAGGYNKATYDNSETLNWRWDNQAIYEKEFGGGVHKLTATLVQSMQKERLESSGMDVFNLPYNSLWYNVGSATNTTTAGVYSGPTVRSNFSQYTLSELIGRINYNYKDRYLLTVSGTYDGSSHLAAGNQYGFFPSAAIKWRLAQENFMKSITPVNDLSFRLSYGSSGNDRIDAYTTQATLGSSATYFGSALAQGYSPNRLANKDLTWETTQEINLGLDFSLLKNRVYGSIDVYSRTIRNILVDKNLPAPAGFNSIKANLGKLRNQGIEIGLSTINIEKGKFSWKTDYVFDANKNAILETANGTKDDVGNLFFIGKPVLVNYDYVFDGIWQTSEADLAAKYNQKPGQVRVKDINNDGVINASDRQILGKKVPSWSGSIGNTFRYGNLDLYVLVYSRQGEQFNSSFDASFMNYNQIYKQLNVDYWTPTNPSNTHFQPGNPGPYVNAIYYRKSDFVRINNITLGYTFPRELLQKYNINGLRLYATATNPLLITKYDGFDPEWTSQNTYGTAISTATYLFGLNLSF